MSRSICLIVIFVASSIAGVCSVQPSTTNSTGASGLGNNTNASSPSTSAPVLPSASAATSSDGTCKPGFLNNVFNTGAPRNAGWPGTTWSTLKKYGMDDWIGFSLTPLNEKSTYNIASGGPAPVTPALNAAQIPIIMDPRDTDSALQLLKTSPPPYLELFNEPDYSFQGVTPLTDNLTAAHNLAQIFATPHPSTQYISPALANANGGWLPAFRDNCDGCFDQIDIIAMHLYNSQADQALDLITQLHGTWPDKRIWITELSPASSDCTLDTAGIVTWAKTLIPQIIALGYVDKIFWNCGESAPGLNGAADQCNPSLTNDDGSPTEVLIGLASICGISGS